MFPSAPPASSIVGKTLTSTGTLATVPAGHWFTGTVMLSASVAVAGASSPKITINGGDAHPPGGSVVAQINLAGLALTTIADSCSMEIVAYADTADITIDFTAGANGVSSGSISGYYF